MGPSKPTQTTVNQDGNSASRRLVGVLITYKRPEALIRHLADLSKQTRRLDRLIVIDNGDSRDVEQIVKDATGAAREISYRAMPDNAGPAGGIAHGMRAILDSETGSGWCVLLDDDDPPRREDLLEVLVQFGASCDASDDRVGMVGMTGARFDAGAGRLRRLADEELCGPVEVDYVAGGQLPLIDFDALRAVGVFREELFFGFDDLEFCLRLRSHGFKVVLDGDLAHWARADAGRLGPGFGGASFASGAAPWRRYYSVRNLIVILLTSGRTLAAAKVAITAGLVKPVLIMTRSPRTGAQHLRHGLHGALDGWLRRMGRRVTPPNSEAASMGTR